MLLAAVGASRVGVRLLAGCVVGCTGVGVDLCLLVGGFNLWCLGEFVFRAAGWSVSGSADSVVFVGLPLVVVVGSVGPASELAPESVSALGLVVVRLEEWCVERVSVYIAASARRSVRRWVSSASSMSKKGGDEDVAVEKGGRTQERLGPWCG